MECVGWNAEKYGMTYDQFQADMNEAMSNSVWMYSRWNELRSKYAGKWIAVYKQDVVAVDNNQDGVFRKLNKLSVPPSKAEIRYLLPPSLIEML